MHGNMGLAANKSMAGPIILSSDPAKKRLHKVFSDFFAVYWNPTRGSGVSLYAGRTGHDSHPPDGEGRLSQEKRPSSFFCCYWGCFDGGR